MDNNTPLPAPQVYDLPMQHELSFPAWKKAIIEGIRVFFMAFIAVISAEVQLGLDIYDYKTWLPPLIISATAAGVKAVIKWAREVYGDVNYSSWLFKIPL